MSIVGLDHVQVSAPPGCEASARAFYGEMLGLVEVAKPPGLAGRGGAWFALADGHQLHVGVSAEFSPAVKAHPALQVTADELDGLARALAQAGHPVQWDAAIPGERRCFTADPWGNRLELVARPGRLIVRDGAHRLSFALTDLLRFHGGDSPAGVAHAFTVLALALPVLSPDGPAPRREVRIRTAFGGPGARDGFELVLRAVSGGRYDVQPALARPQRGAARERFVFGLRRAAGAQELWLGVRAGVVGEEFAGLAFAASRTPAQAARLAGLKAEMAERIARAAPDEVYEFL